jgi:hypothetical protein
MDNSLRPDTTLNTFSLNGRRMCYHLLTPVLGLESFQHRATVVITSPTMEKQLDIAISSYSNYRSGWKRNIDIKQHANLPLYQRQVKSQIKPHVVGS